MSSDFDRDADYLADVLAIAQRIETGLAGRPVDEFLSDAELCDATTYRLLAIGGLLGKLSADVRARHPQIAWREAVAMRNRLAPGYIDVEYERVWRTATHDVPVLAAACRTELARRDADRPPMDD